MQEELAKLLADLGLDEHERAVFLALSELGPSNARTVSRKTGISRTNIYPLTDSLIGMGLVFESKGKGVKTYEAVDQAGLLAYIAKRESDLRQLERRVMQATPVFAALKAGKRQRTKVRFYEGLDGMRGVYQEIKADLKATEGRKEMVTYWPTEALEKAIPDFFENSRFVDMPGFIKRDIFYDCPATQKYIDAYKAGPTTHSYRLWPKERGEFPTDVVVWGSKVSFTDVRGAPAGIVIDNQSVADSMRMWFDAVWESL